MPPIKGIDGKNVIEVTESHAHPELVKGNKILIAGGGLSGCDAGIELAMEGKEVVIVEMQKVIAPDVTKIDNRNWLLDTMEKYNVTAMPGHKFPKSPKTAFMLLTQRATPNLSKQIPLFLPSA